MAAETPDPDAVARFRRDLETLAGGDPGRVGVAVSGGPDSVALLLLAAAACPGRVAAATVDHGLRPASADEARFVASLCAARGIPHAILTPDAPIGGSLQASARAARYALLEAWRAREGIDWLLTAHHLDDQAETVLMRLNRGAGVAGLSGVRAVNGRVLRPLLGWRRAELAGIVAAAGIAAIDDPSNADPRFDRVRMREALARSDWLDPGPVARSAAALAEAEDALLWMTERLLAERGREEAGGWLLDPADLPAELRRRLLLAILAQLGSPTLPRADEVTRLLAALDMGATATLAGVKCRGGATWRFEPAPARRA
jgi:tRNA(Ile)-lysidine synthase